MRLHEQLVLPQARIGLPYQTGATKDEDYITFKVSTAFSRDLAEKFGCREAVYAGDVPRSGIDRIDLEGKDLDCEIHFDSPDYRFQCVAEYVSDYVVDMEGTGPKLSFKVKINGFAISMAELIAHVRIDPIEMTFNPAQQPLFDSKSPVLDDEPALPAPEPETAVLTEGTEEEDLLAPATETVQ